MAGQDGDVPLAVRAANKGGGPRKVLLTDSDSDSDNVPLIARFKATPKPVLQPTVSASKPQINHHKADPVVDTPLKQRQEQKVVVKNNIHSANAHVPSSNGNAKSVPLISQSSLKQKVKRPREDEPLSNLHKKKKLSPSLKRPREDNEPIKRKKKELKVVKGKKKKSAKGGAQDKNSIKWKTLEHSGVLFPPAYSPHGVRMLYDGKPVELTPAQEEVATMYAVMRETDYISKPTFVKNFWHDFKQVLGRHHVMKEFSKCDFTPIYEWHLAEKEKKKNLTKEEKAAAKETKDAAEAKYKVALVDGKTEQVGNFRVEPPGLFRGRGEHPKMGKVKKRVYPKDITINIGRGAKVPEHPFPGQRWKEVRHDRTVTWLAYWRDTVNSRDFKYVWLAATSSFKADSDLAKYEKARKLKSFIGRIRKNYEKDWDARDVRKRQMATALYFIDKLALRAGHEKEDDEADTVGCCTLKKENVSLIPPNHIKFDFLGKDSVRYENTVEVDPKVYKNVERFAIIDQYGKRKAANAQVFDTFDAGDLNKELKGLMDGLSVKVFRTFNASITLDGLLYDSDELSTSVTVDEKKADYDTANKEVAILCNHQRSIPKTHANQMEKLQEKMSTLVVELRHLEEDLKRAVKGQPLKEGGRGNPDVLRNRIAKKKEQISRMELNARVKEDLKTVALGTSKINYMDPRITVAWCKRNEVPIEKVFNKSLVNKFKWAMNYESCFKF